MTEAAIDRFYEEVISKVMSSTGICVALDDKLSYIAVNEVACVYLGIKRGDLLGKSAIGLYPEITASRNHRNILKALSGHTLENEMIESRKGDILKTSYSPFFMDGQVKAIILDGRLQH